MKLTREKLEEIEKSTLASYAIKSADSRGRKYPESEPEYRTRFQRDRDRIIHTSAFRRLEYKTQVFINHEGDYYRTRLTHTIEVAQIGRTIARALSANEDLTETICLAHDLGHPPFGHSGERTLAGLMEDHGGFEHNKHSFRIITELEHRYPTFPGLNLTWEVLEGVVKHETKYDKGDVHDFDPELRGHLEAQIVNLADELAYTTHDLDDGLRSGMLNPSMLEHLEIWQRVARETGIENCTLDDIQRHLAIRHLIGIDVTDLIDHTMHAIISNQITSVDDLQRLSYNVVCHSEELEKQNHQLKDFLFEKLYQQYRVVRMAVKAEQIITDLFNAYKANPQILPAHVQTVIKVRGEMRTICDYIAGMTDRYAIEEHQKLFDPITLP